MRVVQKLGAILWRQLRMPCKQEKMSEDLEECDCSICKRNRGTEQGALEPLKTHIPAPMTIRSIRISQERHRISTTGTIQGEGQPNRSTPETNAKKTTKMLESHQEGEAGQKR